MAKVGRKSVYEDKIKSRFKDIEKWLKGGATEKQVCAALGVGESTWFRLKSEKQEFRDFVKRIDRTEIVLDLRSSLLKKAHGFSYEEKKQYIKKDLITGHDVQYTEIITKQALPDVAAINLALKNYDKEILFVETSVGLWKLYRDTETCSYALYHHNYFKQGISVEDAMAGRHFHRQTDVKETENLEKIIDYVIAHDKAKAPVTTSTCDASSIIT